MAREVLEAAVGEGLEGWALTGVGTMGHEQLHDADTETILHLCLLCAGQDYVTQQEDDVGEDSVTIFSGSPGICTSFQQETDALCVVDLDDITAAITMQQGVQQRCLSCSRKRQSDETVLHLETLTPEGRKIINFTNPMAKHKGDSPSTSRLPMLL